MLSVNTSQSIVECRFNLKFTEELNRISIHNSAGSSAQLGRNNYMKWAHQQNHMWYLDVSVWMTCNLSPHFIMCHDAVNATLIHTGWNGRDEWNYMAFEFKI